MNHQSSPLLAPHQVDPGPQTRLEFLHRIPVLRRQGFGFRGSRFGFGLHLADQCLGLANIEATPFDDGQSLALESSGGQRK